MLCSKNCSKSFYRRCVQSTDDARILHPILLLLFCVFLVCKFGLTDCRSLCMQPDEAMQRLAQAMIDSGDLNRLNAYDPELLDATLMTRITVPADVESQPGDSGSDEAATSRPCRPDTGSDGECTVPRPSEAPCFGVMCPRGLTWWHSQGTQMKVLVIRPEMEEIFRAVETARDNRKSVVLTGSPGTGMYTNVGHCCHIFGCSY